MSICEICNRNPVDIHTTAPNGKSMQLCWECNNRLAAEYLDIKLVPFNNDIYEYSGIRGKKHKFIIHKMVHPIGIGYEAIEITGDNTPGFRVEVLDSLECDQLALFNKFEAKIKRTISKRYLKTSTSSYGDKQTTFKTDKVVGRFEYDENEDFHKVIIDGKAFTWDELGRMLNPYEGFQFKLKIYDITDDVE